MFDSFDEIIDDLNDRCMNIPMSNSDFMIEIHEDEKMTPARKYRYLVLQAQKEARALKINQLKHDREKIKIKQSLRRLTTEKDEDERALIQIDIEEFEFNRNYLKALVVDATNRLKTILNRLKEYKRYSREEFEAEEKEHFEKKFKKDIIGQTGAKNLLSLIEGDSPKKQLKSPEDSIAPYLAMIRAKPNGAGNG